MLRVSTHAPLAGCDEIDKVKEVIGISFNSRAPRGVRPSRLTYTTGSEMFQLTRPSRGATVDHEGYKLAPLGFQLTRPSRGATAKRECPSSTLWVSTHAPLAGCDTRSSALSQSSKRFNSRAPRGVRLVEDWFNPGAIFVSTHAPLAGCDLRAFSPRMDRSSFNSRAPRGVRQRRTASSEEF